MCFCQRSVSVAVRGDFGSLSFSGDGVTSVCASFSGSGCLSGTSASRAGHRLATSLCRILCLRSVQTLRCAVSPKRSSYGYRSIFYSPFCGRRIMALYHLLSVYLYACGRCRCLPFAALRTLYPSRCFLSIPFPSRAWPYYTPLTVYCKPPCYAGILLQSACYKAWCIFGTPKKLFRSTGKNRIKAQVNGDKFFLIRIFATFIAPKKSAAVRDCVSWFRCNYNGIVVVVRID